MPHEAWHVVQQVQGRVRPTMQLKNGLSINGDETLECEADVMGAKALQITRSNQVTMRSTSLQRRKKAAFHFPVPSAAAHVKASHEAVQTVVVSGLLQMVGLIRKEDLESDVLEVKLQINPKMTPGDIWIYKVLDKLATDFSVKKGNTEILKRNLIEAKVINQDDLTTLEGIIERRIKFHQTKRDLRAERSVLDDRHEIRAPDSTEKLQIWFKSLATGRIADLYRTVEGYETHAIQIQAEINRMLAAETQGTISKPEVDGVVEHIKAIFRKVRPQSFSASHTFNFGPMRASYRDENL